jgi:hypothetical protein
MVTVTTSNETLETNRVTVLVPDSAVYLDQGVVIGLDFSGCGIPEDMRCMHWVDGVGEIQYVDTRPNLDITEIPEWALNCVRLWVRPNYE